MGGLDFKVEWTFKEKESLLHIIEGVRLVWQKVEN